MSSRRAPSTPPQLRGFDFVRLLGSGGFADVFLYQQRLPRRRVAVKVLLTEKVSTTSSRDFVNEANLMAQLSTHPSIVTIYEAGVAGDGRPYLAMEYCPKPNLQIRYRKGPFSVAEALRIGIQVAGAVETAHRAGILHRDIKPANILVTEYNRPSLTDFGIAGTTVANEAVGMSIPWSPPEAFIEGAPSTERSDVFSLAATVYTLLAGRSPFEIPGERNTSAQLISRIQSSPLPSLGRADMPISLQRILEKAMAKSPDRRHASALDFARELQKIEIELNMSVTYLDILDDSIDEALEDNDDDGRTRIRGLVSIDPTGAPGVRSSTESSTTDRPFSTTDATVLPDSIDEGKPVSPSRPSGPSAVLDELEDATVLRGTPQVVVPGSSEADGFQDQTRMRTTTETDDGGEARPRRSWVRIGVVTGVVILFASVVGLATVLGGKVEPSPTPIVTPTMPVPPAIVPTVENVTATIEGERLTFTWENPDPREGDSYLWGVQVVGEVREFFNVTEQTVSVDLVGDEEICIEVFLRRVDGRASGKPGIGCAP